VDDVDDVAERGGSVRQRMDGTARGHVDRVRLDCMASRGQRLGAGVEGLLVEVCEEDCSSCPLAACDRLADAARADGDDYFFLVHRVLLSTLAVDHRLLRGLVAVAGSGDLCRFDLA
jgi:hypothetical protein